MSSEPVATASSSVEARLKITEIFHSIQGEADSAGWPTTFVRLTGCPLRCTWCDTAYAFQGGSWMTIDAILAQVVSHGAKRVCVTGGEPLAQRRCLALLERLADEGYAVSLETSGALDIAEVDPRVTRIMDLKAPDSGEVARNRWQNLECLQPGDQLKIVVASRGDFDWARRVIDERVPEGATVLLSPVWETLPPRDLADWILETGVQARLQVQLHKVLWGEEPGR